MRNLHYALCLLSVLLLFSCKKDPAAKVSKVATFQPDATLGKDAFMDGYSTVADVVSEPSAQFSANASTSSGETFFVRSVIAFDLTSIPSNLQIDSAILSLYAWNNTGGLGKHRGENACWLQKVTTDWDEITVTWNNQPTTTTQNQVALTQSTDPAQDYPHIVVTSLVQDMVTNPSQNFGLMLKLQSESIYSTLNFLSSDCSEPTRRPKLVVYYKQ